MCAGVRSVCESWFKRLKAHTKKLGILIKDCYKSDMQNSQEAQKTFWVGLHQDNFIKLGQDPIIQP